MIFICSVGGSFDVDMAEGPEGYVCAECGTQFKGIGKDLKCPKCSSDKVVKIGWEYIYFFRRKRNTIPFP